MALAFAGTAPFGADILRGLLDGLDVSGAGPDVSRVGREVSLVISQPDRPAGRGRKLSPSAVAQLARERGLELVQPERMHEPAVLERLGALDVDTIVVAAFGQMIREPLLSDFLMLNVHGSLLPAWRGAAPIERAIMHGSDHTGVCIMRMDAGLDTGPVASSARVTIDTDDDAGTIYKRCAAAGGELLHAALDAAAAGTLSFTSQPDDGATYAHKIVAEDRALDVREPARRVHDRVRALSPHIGAWLELDGQRVTVWASRVVDATGGQRGAVGDVRHDRGRLVVRCGGGALELVEVQPPGKRRMPAGEWLRGLREPLSRVTSGPVVQS